MLNLQHRQQTDSLSVSVNTAFDTDTDIDNIVLCETRLGAMNDRSRLEAVSVVCYVQSNSLQ